RRARSDRACLSRRCPNKPHDKVFRTAAAEPAAVRRVKRAHSRKMPRECTSRRNCSGSQRPPLQRAQARTSTVDLAFAQDCFAASRKCLTRSCALLISLNCRETVSRTGPESPLCIASSNSCTAESSPRSHSLRIALSSPLVTADLRLIQARCIAPAVLLVFSGSDSPRLRACVCNSFAKRERCCEYC